MTPKKLPTGIRKHAYGLRARVRVHQGSGGVISKVFPPGTSLLLIRQWRENVRAIHKAQPVTLPQRPQGFAADAARYLEAVKGMPSYSDRERDIQQWVAAFGDTPRSAITSADIRTQLARWQELGKAASTLNHRRTALMHLYAVLDGKAAQNPVRDVPKYREPAPEPRALSRAVIETIFKAMPETKTKARLLVMAETGLPPATIKRLTKDDVDLKGRSFWLPARHKGKGARGRRLPLSERGVQAFALFAKLEAWGDYSNSSVHASFRRACNKLGIPKGVSPYWLRHSFGTEVYLKTGDIRATKELMQHSAIKMTERYTLGAVDARAEAAIRALDSDSNK